MSLPSKHRHALSNSLGGEGQTQGWRLKWLGSGKWYRFYRSAPNVITVASNVAEAKLKIGKAFRLIRVEWSFNDTTAKDMDVTVTHPEMNQLSNPTKIIHLDDDTNANGYKSFGTNMSLRTAQN